MKNDTFRAGLTALCLHSLSMMAVFAPNIGPAYASLITIATVMVFQVAACVTTGG